MSPKKKPGLILESTVTQDIAEMQLNRLRDIAMNRLLTLEECKQLDLLNKNLLLALGHANTIIDLVGSAEQLPTTDLLAVAESKQISFKEVLDAVAAPVDEDKPDDNG